MVHRITVKHPKLFIFIGCVILFHAWLHFSNPYAPGNFVQQPYTTKLEHGVITYEQHYSSEIWSDPVADLLGYYRQGFLIVENTLFGGSRIDRPSADEVIDEIHRIRFDPTKPYLISGDQFSVLYPRNLGVFYNQLLDPATARSQVDWESRQRIYLQSALYAIDGLADSDVPKTTLVPIGPRTLVTTQVHPGDIGSDSVYGVLYALNAMNAPADASSTYPLQTKQAVQRILREKKPQLEHIVASYIAAVQDPGTGLVRSDVHLASARDGVTRQSSFYDTIVLWKTLQLADTLGIRATPAQQLDTLRQRIKARYWSEADGYYHNDIYDHSFSSDWLIGYVTGFFDLHDKTDFERSLKTIAYIDTRNIAEPLPIKYQVGSANDMPFIIRTFVPMYGSEAIWSYWGAQYITLLADVSRAGGSNAYLAKARSYIQKYEAAIVRDGGFAETFAPDGSFLQHGVYKSIRITGWVVQFEHARNEVTTAQD